MSNDTNNTFYLDTPNNSPRPASVEDFPTLGLPIIFTKLDLCI